MAIFFLMKLALRFQDGVSYLSVNAISHFKIVFNSYFSVFQFKICFSELQNEITKLSLVTHFIYLVCYILTIILVSTKWVVLFLLGIKIMCLRLIHVVLFQYKLYKIFQLIISDNYRKQGFMWKLKAIPKPFF